LKKALLLSVSVLGLGFAFACSTASPGDDGAPDAAAPESGAPDTSQPDVLDSSTADAADAGGDGGQCVTQEHPLSTGNIQQNQSFNETRALVVVPVTDRLALSLNIKGVTLMAATAIGARIYDAAGTRIAGGDSAVQPIGPLAAGGLNIPLTSPVTLVAGETYRVAISINGNNNNGDLATPTFPYLDSSGAFNVTAARAGLPDMAPDNVNFGAPQITLASCGKAAPVCNTLANDAPGVAEQSAAGQPPTMTGGTIPDGTYLLSARADYTGGTCNCTTHAKWNVSGGGTKIDVVVRTDPKPDNKLSGALTTSGTSLALGFTCPATRTISFQYSVSTTAGTQLVTYDPVKKQLETYTKQ
jgi:hypothetical protein